LGLGCSWAASIRRPRGAKGRENHTEFFSRGRHEKVDFSNLADAYILRSPAFSNVKQGGRNFDCETGKWRPYRRFARSTLSATCFV
jgi:hypothetical protein